jgi:hypothetical protein
MNGQEFKEWYRDFRTHFKMVAAWMTKREDEKDALAAWNRALSGVRLGDAKKATEELFADASAQPESWDQFPATIRWLANRYRSGSRATGTRHVIDGEITYRCLDCEDSGFVSIFDPRIVNAIRWGKSQRHADAGEVATAVARCTCEAGKKIGFVVGTYDPMMDVKVSEVERRHCHDEKNVANIQYEETLLEALTRRIEHGSPTNDTEWTPESETALF